MDSVVGNEDQQQRHGEDNVSEKQDTANVGAALSSCGLLRS